MCASMTLSSGAIRHRSVTKLYLLNATDSLSQTVRCDFKLKVSRLAYEYTERLVREAYHTKGVEFRREPGGKPYIEPRVCEISISHSGGLILIGLSDKPLGVDTELVRRFGEKTARRVFTESERRYAQGSDKRMFELWTMRESLGKATGEGVFTLLNEEMSDGAELVRQKERNGKLYSFSLFYEFGAVCAVCCESDSPEKIELKAEYIHLP